jgi:hypothetical protein
MPARAGDATVIVMDKISTPTRAQVLIVALAPAVLLAGIIYHPYLARLTNGDDVAAAAGENTTRWGLSHLVVGLGFALSAAAFVALRNFLDDAGDRGWSAKAVPFAVVGSALAVFLPAMEIAMVAVAEAGADLAAVLTELQAWFLAMQILAAVAFQIGAVGFALAIMATDVLSPQVRRVAAVALVVSAAARFVPLGAVLYIGAVAGVVALWSLAYAMWKPAEQRTQVSQAVPAT